jgi:hypothetical protein
MIGTQRDLLISVTDQLRLMSYAIIQDIGFDTENLDVQVVYDLAASLQDLQAVLLTIPHIKR